MNYWTSLTQHPVRTALSILAICGTLVVWFWLPPQPGSHQTVAFTVSDGQGTRSIATGLKDHHLIRSSTVFVLYTRASGIQSSLKAGTYILSPNMSVPEIADIIAGGKGISSDIEVTIPEGSNAWDIDRILSASGLPILRGQFSAQYRIDEGRFFPETYRFAKDATIRDIALRLTDEFSIRATGTTPAQIIIASILEKEAKTAEDMALVSGIIAKRIKLDMPLQVDATVGYGWCVRTTPHGNLCDVTQAPINTEIKRDGPYNTYTRKGLPVGPIANPGLEAIAAAVHPKESPYLYYLSTRDGSQLIYAKTLQEHLQNRQKYLGF